MQLKEPRSDGPKCPFDLILIDCDPVLPSLHGLLTGVVLGAQILRRGNFIDDVFDDFAAVMPVWCQDVWKFSMQAVTPCTAHAAYLDRPPDSTVPFPDPSSPVPVAKSLTTVRADRIFSAHAQK